MKDKQGHGSNKRSDHTVDTTFSSTAGVGGLGKGMYARTHSGDMYKLNAAATNGMVPRVGSEIDPSQHTRVIAAQHDIPTAHLDTGKFGPFASAVAGFREKYGAPRDLKAEQRGFASGKREINRLRSQGK